MILERKIMIEILERSKEHKSDNFAEEEESPTLLSQ